MIILTILAYLLLFILLLITLLIIIPIDYKVEGSKYDNLSIMASITLYAGILKLKINAHNLDSINAILKVFGYPISININESNEDQNKTSTEKKDFWKNNEISESNINLNSKKKNQDLIQYLSKDLIDYCLSFVKKIWHRIRPKRLEINAIYGFDDPFNTAVICGTISALYPLLKDYSVSLTPSFSETTLKGRFIISGKIAIIVILYYVIKFVITNPIRSLIKKIIKNKKEEKTYAE